MKPSRATFSSFWWDSTDWTQSLEAILDETAALLRVSPGALLPQSTRATADALIVLFSEFRRNHVSMIGAAK